jgi:hypothetical protein
LTESEVRALFLKKLNRIAERLPNGLLHRLVDDAQFFQDWNLKKRRARASARLAQHRAWEAKAEERYWKTVETRR